MGSVNENVLPWPGIAFNPDLPTVILDNFLADRQPKACAFRLIGKRISYLLELLEHLRLIRRGNANAGVCYADNQDRPGHDERRT